MKIGATSGENTIIEEGLEPGQIVVIDGLDKLRDRSKIRIVDRNAEAAALEAGKKPAEQKPDAPAVTKTDAKPDTSDAGKTPAPAATPGVAKNGTAAPRQ